MNLLGSSKHPVAPVCAAALVLLLLGCSSGSMSGGGGNGGGGGNNGGTTQPPSTPLDLRAAAGDAQITLNWTASAGASSYALGRSTTSGGPYEQIATAATTYLDTGLTNGTAYYYVVAAVNSAGTSPNS